MDAAEEEYEAAASMAGSSGPSSGPSSVPSSGLRPNSAAGEDPPLRRSATHTGAGPLVRSTSASALGRGLPGGASSALTRYGTSSLGVDLFGTGGIGFDRGRQGRRQLRAPARLAQLNREDELGPRQVKRLLAKRDALKKKSSRNQTKQIVKGKKHHKERLQPEW